MTERAHVRIEHNELWPKATPALAPGVVGVDAGMTLTKVARASEGGIALAWYGTNDEGAGARIAAEVESAARVGVTGALLGAVHAGERFVRVQEIDAAARGVLALMESDGRAGSDGFVMVLLGTGTAFAAVRGENVTHLGGTPLGGGSFAGMATTIGSTLGAGVAISPTHPAKTPQTASDGTRRTWVTVARSRPCRTCYTPIVNSAVCAAGCPLWWAADW